MSGFIKISSKISFDDSIRTDNAENKIFTLIQSKSPHMNISEKCECCYKI